jgi:uncharacterized integral membrane protein
VREAVATRTGSGLIGKSIFVTVLAAAMALFALQNSAPATIRFLAWRFEGVPLATPILVAAAVGVVLVGPALLIGRARLRSRIRALEARLAALGARLAERGPGSGG